MILQFATIHYQAVRDRIKAQDPDLDEQTLADTVEGLTKLPDIIEAIVRSALLDEALVKGLKCRIAELQSRIERFQDRASKRRAIAKDVMVDLGIKKINAPDFTASIRAGLPSLLVLMKKKCQAFTGSRANRVLIAKASLTTSSKALT